MGLGFQYGFQLFISLTQLVHFSVSDQKDYRHTLEGLVQVMIELVCNHVQESAWIVSTAAQRVNLLVRAIAMRGIYESLVFFFIQTTQQ
jgi:hypothetical protein